jgi:hypothetical protein
VWRYNHSHQTPILSGPEVCASPFVRIPFHHVPGVLRHKFVVVVDHLRGGDTIDTSLRISSRDVDGALDRLQSRRDGICAIVAITVVNGFAALVAAAGFALCLPRTGVVKASRNVVVPHVGCTNAVCRRSRGASSVDTWRRYH